MSVTIRQVAHAAGVSVSTASRVLSGDSRVSVAAATGVRSAARDLGYRVNTAARSLRTRSTQTIGMVVPRFSNPYFPQVVEVVERELSTTGRELFLCDSQDDVSIEIARIDALLSRRIDGLLIAPCDRSASAESLRRALSQVPVVQVDRSVLDDGCDFVGVDSAAGIRKAVLHLWDTGCRSFAMIGSADRSSSSLQRADAYTAAVEEVGAAGRDVILLGDYSLAWGMSSAAELLARSPLVDAIVCGADIIAVGVMKTLQDAHLRIPEDVSVTGFDDIEFAAISNPGLTTISQPVVRLGVEAIRLLERRLNGHTEGRQSTVFDAQLVQRGSTRSERRAQSISAGAAARVC